MSRSPLAPNPDPHETGQSRQRAWVEVNGEAVRQNTMAIRRLVGAPPPPLPPLDEAKLHLY